MLRWMISPVIGAGTIQNPYRALVDDLSSVNVSAIIPTFASGPNTGKPKYRFALCYAATANVGVIAAVVNSFVFPDYVLDGRMDGMDAAARLAMVQSVQAYDLDGDGLHFNAANADDESYRALLLRLVQQLEPSIGNLNGFTVGEVSA